MNRLAYILMVRELYVSVNEPTSLYIDGQRTMSLSMNRLAYILMVRELYVSVNEPTSLYIDGQRTICLCQ